MNFLELSINTFFFITWKIRCWLLSIFPKLLERRVTTELSKLGVTVNGKEPWDIHVRDPQFFVNVSLDLSMGLGEGYMDEQWTVKDLDAFFRQILAEKKKIKRTDREITMSRIRKFFKYLRFHVINYQNQLRAWEVGQKHYDIGNDLFESMLDPYMNYSCGYWKTATTLEDAQIHKMDLIARKLKLQPGMKVLDIGCGWGGLAKYLATHFNVNVVGVTISKEQIEYATEFCKGLPCEFKLMDYRDISEEFDRIVSVGMFEHVGINNYADYFATAAKCLKSDGLFLLHTIGMNNVLQHRVDSWIEKYIFPNGVIPYFTDIAKCTEKVWVVEDWHNFGHYYSQTLDAWLDNYEENWHKFKDVYDERFYRMFRFYLIKCANLFRSRHCQLWQVVLSKNGVPGGYESER